MEILTEIVLKNSSIENVKRSSAKTNIETDMPGQLLSLPGSMVPIIANDGCAGYAKIITCSIGTTNSTFTWTLVKTDPEICNCLYKIYKMRSGNSITGSYQSRDDGSGKYSLRDNDNFRSSLPKSVRDFLDD